MKRPARFAQKLSFVFYVFWSVFLLLAAPAPMVAALSKEQQDIYSEGILYYDAEVSAAGGVCGDANLAGSGNIEKVYNFLVSKGLTAVQAAGVMGNMQAESHFEPRLVEYGYLNSRGEVSEPGQPSSLDDTAPPNQNSLGQPGYGLSQWGGGRKEALHAAAVKAGTKDSDLLTQLNYLWSELTGSYKSSTYEPLLASTDIRDATTTYMLNFEHPADTSQDAQNSRVRLASALLTKYGSGSATSDTASDSVSCATDSNGQVSGGYSLPVAQKWYDQHPDWFTKPHHDYPAADIPVPTNTPVYSMTAGKVISAPVGGDCGTGVEVDAGNGVLFLYCHGLDGGSVPGVQKGDTVKAGQLIMHSDNTGNSTGPHVHVEIKISGTDHCPQQLLTAIATNASTIPELNNLPTSGCTY